MPIGLLPAASGADTYAWVDPSGVEHAFDAAPGAGTGYLLLAGASGRWGTPIEVTGDALATRPGMRVRRARRPARTLDLPLHVWGTTRAQMLSRLRQLSRWLDTTDGSGWLRATGTDGVRREIAAYYTGGLDGDDRPGDATPTTKTLVASLICPDPYWRDADPLTTTYGVPLAPSNLLFKTPFFPLYLPASAVWAQPLVTNDGDAEAYPVWTITGPGDGLALFNLTTGKVLRYTATIPAGQALTIDTNPTAGGLPVTDSLGANRFADLSSDSSLWPLALGTNQLQLEVGNATGATSVALAWRRRYLAPTP